MRRGIGSRQKCAQGRTVAGRWQRPPPTADPRAIDDAHPGNEPAGVDKGPCQFSDLGQQPRRELSTVHAVILAKRCWPPGPGRVAKGSLALDVVVAARVGLTEFMAPQEHYCTEGSLRSASRSALGVGHPHQVPRWDRCVKGEFGRGARFEELDDDFLMSRLFTAAEVEGARLALTQLSGTDLDVVVRGLGLGFTALTVPADPRVRSMAAIEALGPVKRWTQRNRVT